MPKRKGAAFLRQTLRRCRRALVATAVFSCFINILMLTASLYSLQLFDRVLTSRSISTLIYLTVIALVAFAVLWLLDLARAQVMSIAATWIEERMGPRLFAGAVAGHAPVNPGPATTQPLRDLALIRNFLGGPYLFPILDAPWAPVILVALFFLHPLLGSIAIVGTLVLLGLAIANDLLTRTAQERQAALTAESNYDCDVATRSVDSVRAMGLIGALTRAWKTRQALITGYTRHASFRANLIGSLSRVIRQVLQIFILAAGAWLTLSGEISPGALIASTILVARALAPVEQAIGSWRQVAAAREAHRRIGAFIENAETQSAPAKIMKPIGRVRAEEVIYLHPGTREPTLRGVTFSLEPGDFLAIVGPSGSGKTTLARLLVGALKPNAGAVRFDGIDITAWDPEDRGPQIGFLPQAVELFRGTIEENIARMREVPSAAVVKATELARAHELVQSLPNGYQTAIGEGGLGLSSGQRQRIGMARAIFGNPKFIVMDEPNAHLDQLGEAALAEAVTELKRRGTTLVIITHRTNLLELVDKVLILREGRVAAFGPRTEVLTRIAQHATAARAQPARPEGAHG
jgi:PrtD family type I secretion system ABC transporter